LAEAVARYKSSKSPKAKSSAPNKTLTDKAASLRFFEDAARAVFLEGPRCIRTFRKGTITEYYQRVPETGQWMQGNIRSGDDPTTSLMQTWASMHESKVEGLNELTADEEALVSVTATYDKKLFDWLTDMLKDEPDFRISGVTNLYGYGARLINISGDSKDQPSLNLSTRHPIQMDPSVPCPRSQEILDEFFPETPGSDEHVWPRLLIRGWIYAAWRQGFGHWSATPGLFLLGDRGVGKSHIATMMTWIAGGTSAEVARNSEYHTNIGAYINPTQQGDKFNKAMGSAFLWLVDDPPTTDQKHSVREATARTLKELINNLGVRIRGMRADGVVLPCNRCVLYLSNDDETSLASLPLLQGGSGQQDKFIVLHATSGMARKWAGDERFKEENRMAFLEEQRKEMPGLLYECQKAYNEIQRIQSACESGMQKTPPDVYWRPGRVLPGYFCPSLGTQMRNDSPALRNHERLVLVLQFIREFYGRTPKVVSPADIRRFADSAASCALRGKLPKVLNLREGQALLRNDPIGSEIGTEAGMRGSPHQLEIWEEAGKKLRAYMKTAREIKTHLLEVAREAPGMVETQDAEKGRFKILEQSWELVE